MRNQKKKIHNMQIAILAILLITACAAGSFVVSRGEVFTGTSPFISGNYTHAEAFTGYSIAHGIDVSKWQTNINWTAAKEAGVDFALIRVGNRGYGESGIISYDGYYTQNMQNAIAAEVKVGVYIYSQAITEDEAREEAQYILDRVGDYNITMPLVIDYEYAEVNGSLGGRLYNAHLSREAATNVCMAFCDVISAAGYTPMVYANKSLLENDINADVISAKYPIWLANYTTKTTYAGAYTFWQYTSSAVVTWVNTSLETGVGSCKMVDCNFWYYKEGEGFLTGNGNPVTSTKSPEPTQTPTPEPTQTPETNISISDCTVSGLEAKYEYTGAKIKPQITIKYNKTKLKKNTDYTITYAANKNVGTATITIKGTGNYQGTLSKNFKIIPPAPENVRERNKTAHSVTLQWDKVSKCSGYIIFRATKNGDYKKIATIKNKKTTIWTNTKLAKKTRYYYIIQSYWQGGGTKYKSDYSEEIAVKTLKK